MTDRTSHDTIDLDGLRSGLHDLAEASVPPIRTDLADVRARGARARRRRRAARAAVPLAAGLAAAAVIAVPAGGDGHRPSVASGRPAARDPLTGPATFGALPAGYRVTITDDASGTFQLTAAKKGGLPQYVLSVYPPGREPAMGMMRGAVPARRVPAGKVNGRAAHWLQPPPPGAGTAAGEARLRFQSPDGRWAELELDAAPAGTDLAAQIHRVAAGVRFAPAPLAVPVRLRDLPAGLRLIGTSVSTDATSGIGWRTVLTFSAATRSRDLTVTLGKPAGDRMWAGGRRAPNTTVDGHAAYRQAAGPARTKEGLTRVGAGLDVLCVYEVTGTDVCLEATPKGSALLKATGGLPGLYARTTVLGTDPARWTSAPLG
ncbi:hypothetical protein [Actinomadura parmotrematis]|uniref:Uncharacterized protein n=1 Tax=Actinomadura parmotrematis TaxID=2864039 RepID=A0ABS7FNE3_9ACTN|nr:hypothetical protein [Actinomadura parmotrematis]MBW8481750.1 hypothetical protein [Actinomadura parmotrematis]